MNGPPTDSASEIRKRAARAWLEMDAAGVVPTPRNFDLWFRHISGAAPELSRQIAALKDRQPSIDAASLEALHDRFPGSEIDVDEVADQTESLHDAAQTLVDQVAGNQEPLRQYGNTLTHWATQLGQNRSLETLLQAIATLTEETGRASERNRTLEQQLSASCARIARLKDSMASLKREATTDTLTGLVNRRTFGSRLRRALAQAKADHSPVSVLVIDVDHFKRVNDTFGHPTGDAVLKLIARLLSDSLKGRDTAARYGGEEFAVLLMGADLKAGATVANQIRSAIESKPLIRKRAADEPSTITVSVGVAQFRSDETAASLIARADAALYQAKGFGRNQVCAAQ
jgi:diguanylate cyclase